MVAAGTTPQLKLITGDDFSPRVFFFRRAEEGVLSEVANQKGELENFKNGFSTEGLYLF